MRGTYNLILALIAGVLCVAVASPLPLAAQAVEKAKAVANNLKQNVGEKVATYAETVVGESISTAATEPPMGRA